MTVEVTTLAELQRWKRRELIKNLEAKFGAAASGPDHVRLRRLFAEAEIVVTDKKRRRNS
jgi:hypothetical protein